MIKVEGLSVNYGAVRALREVSFEAPTGQITAVLGANGAGKTTLLRTISGLVAPKSGSIFLDEQSLVGVATENIARMGVAHVPEGRGVIEELTVEENLRLGAMAAKVNLTEGLAEQYERFAALGVERSSVPPCRAANVRCWPCRGPSSLSRAFCFLTSRRSAWPPR
jgi:branched-chain amino acid transport system ATP-binding protein